MTRRGFTTVVSGLPRSGTSLAMQMLEAGGVPVLHDGARAADADNPRGYYEYAAVKRPETGAPWLAGAAGYAVKVVCGLAHRLPDGPELRVVLLLRDLGEVLSSQRRMLERSGADWDPSDDERLRPRFEALLERTRSWARERPRTALLEIGYADLLAAPLAAAERLEVFLGGGLDIAAMAERPDAGLFHSRLG